MSAVYDDLAELASIGATGEGVTRLAWTTELRDAYTWLTARCEQLGMAVEIDAAGNLIARWEAGSGPAVAVGSHVDTVPNGGHFDGALGVVGGLHAIRMLKQRGVTPTRPIWLIAFMDEENTRFGTALFGSRAFVGEPFGELDRRRDRDGVSVAQAMAGWDRGPADLGDARRIDQVGAYLELHIEQGPRLERDGVDVGAVNAIVGLVGYRVRLLGETNHAGTTPMDARRDALAGAARVISDLREESRRRAGTTVNVGVIGVEPGGSNVVPGACSFTIDLRAPDGAELAAFDQAARDLLTTIAQQEHLELEVQETYRVAPAPMDAGLVALIERSAELEEASVVRMPSGAGHDAMVLAPHVPTAMVFVPSRAGISHSPLEHTTPEHCELGARVLARTLEELVSGATATDRIGR